MIDAQGTIKWIKSAQLGIIPDKTKVSSRTFSFSYKRGIHGPIEERISRASLSGDQMLPGIHYDPNCESSPMVDRIAARMIISYSVGQRRTLEHLDVRSAFLHEDYTYEKPVYIREAARADGTFKNGKMVGIPVRNLYGNPSGMYYYVQFLL